MSCPAPFIADQLAFEAGLAAVPGADDAAAIRDVVALPSGGLNASYRVVTARGDFVLRIADAGSRAERLGVDRRREQLLHGLAAEAGLAPPVLAAAPDGRWHVRRFVQGLHWGGSDFDSSRQVRRLGAALRRLQSIPTPPLAPLDPLALMSRWSVALAERSPRDSQFLSAAFDVARAAFARLEGARRAPCIVHSDLHGDNILDSGALCFIDWEYAQVADPLCEIGSLLAAQPQLERHADELLAAAGLAGRASRDELDAWTTIYRSLNSLWRRLAWEP